MKKKQKEYLKLFREKVDKPYYFHLAHYLNVRNVQINHLNEMKGNGLISLKKHSNLIVIVKLTEKGKESTF